MSDQGANKKCGCRNHAKQRVLRKPIAIRDPRSSGLGMPSAVSSAQWAPSAVLKREAWCSCVQLISQESTPRLMRAATTGGRCMQCILHTACPEHCTLQHRPWIELHLSIDPVICTTKLETISLFHYRFDLPAPSDHKQIQTLCYNNRIIKHFHIKMDKMH